MTDKRVVPREPTEEMVIAGMEADVLGRPSVDDDGHILSIYKAMIAAALAPSPVEPEAGELLPCPYCGCRAKMTHPHGEYFVQCTRLGTCYGRHNSTGEEGYKFEKDAIEVWNRRAPAEDGELRRLEREIATYAAIDCLESECLNANGWIDKSWLPNGVGDDELRYLELRGLLEHHPTDKNLVRVKEQGE